MFQCEFSNDACFVIRVIYGNWEKEVSQDIVKAKIQDKEVSQYIVKAKIQDKEVSQDTIPVVAQLVFQ